MTRSPLTSNNSASTPMRTCTTFMRIFKHCVKKREIPLLSEEGWLSDQENVAKPPLPRRRARSASPIGRSSNSGEEIPEYVCGDSPPRPLHQMWLRAIFIDVASTPPRRGGESFAPKPILVGILIVLCSAILVAQGPPRDSWPTYHGDYTGQRHSRLTEITPDNINRLSKVWTFQTGQNQQIKATPILVNGVIYISTPDNLWAVDAHNGKELWHYKAPENNAFHIGHRGAAIYKDTVYLTTPDAHLIALNTKDGSV